MLNTHLGEKSIKLIQISVSEVTGRTSYPKKKKGKKAEITEIGKNHTVH